MRAYIVTVPKYRNVSNVTQRDPGAPPPPDELDLRDGARAAALASMAADTDPARRRRPGQEERGTSVMAAIPPLGGVVAECAVLDVYDETGAVVGDDGTAYAQHTRRVLLAYKPDASAPDLTPDELAAGAPYSALQYVRQCVTPADSAPVDWSTIWCPTEYYAAA